MHAIPPPAARLEIMTAFRLSSETFCAGGRTGQGSAPWTPAKDERARALNVKRAWPPPQPS
jgi:hypothetical protein